MKIKAGYINNMRSYIQGLLFFIGIFSLFAAIIPIVISKTMSDTNIGTTDIFFATEGYVSIAYAMINLLSFNINISFGMSRKNFSITSILTNVSFCAIAAIIIVIMQYILRWFVGLFGLTNNVSFYIVDEFSQGNIFLSMIAAFFLILLITNIIYVFVSILYNTSRVQKFIFILIVSIISLTIIYWYLGLNDQGQIDFMVSIGNFFGVDSQAISLGRFILSSSFVTMLCMAFTSFKDQRREIKTKVA